MADTPNVRSQITRRRLLATAGILGAGGLVAACAPGAPAAAPTSAPAAPAATTAAGAAKPAATTAAPAAAAPAKQGVAQVLIHLSGEQESAVPSTGSIAQGNFGPWAQEEIFKGHLEKFNQANPNVKASVDYFLGRPFSEKILAKKTAGQLGDIVVGTGLPLDAFARNEVLRPIDDQLLKAANVDLGQYDQTAIEVLRYDPKTGKRGAGAPLYGLPTAANPGATILFLNPEMFAKKGVKPPTPEMSFTDLVETGKAMTERKAGAEVADVYGWLYSPFWFVDVTTTWLRDFGANMFDPTGKKATLNTKEAMDAFKFIYDGIYTHKISPRPDQLNAMGGYKPMFLQQKTAMFRLAPWGSLAMVDMPAKGQPGYFDWDAIVMPKGPSGQRGTSLGAEYLGLTTASKNPEAALQVMAWLTNQEGGTLNCFLAAMCGARADVRANPVVKGHKFLQVSAATVAEAKPQVFAANGRQTEAFAALTTEFEKLLNDQGKPDQAFFDNMNNQVQRVLDMPAS